VPRLRIDLAYDGAPFAGFARQPDQVTVQGELEGTLRRVLGQAVSTVCAGRTDRGVHARGQVVHVDFDAADPRAVRALGDLAALRFRLDRLTGPAIAIWAVRPVGDAFDARFSAIGRSYCFRLVDAPAADPLRRADRWHLEGPLDLQAMRAAARGLVGEHDFAAFCRRSPGRTSVRRLDEVRVSRPRPGRMDLWFAGRAFCHQQVRSMVGCLVEVGRGRREAGWVAAVLASGDRSRAAAVAPPHGLTLERVSYGRRWPASPPRWVGAALGPAGG